MGAMNISIKLVTGEVAPKYPDATELQCDEVVITEKATVKGLPIADFVLSGPDGRKYILVLSGRILNAVAASVKGANLRNHGVEEP